MNIGRLRILQVWDCVKCKERDNLESGNFSWIPSKHCYTYVATVFFLILVQIKQWLNGESVSDGLRQCFPNFLMPRTPCSECYFTVAPIKSKMEICCILHTYDKNEVINHNFPTLNVSSMTMQYCINGDFRMNMNILNRPNIMNLTLT
jgi:hypothetical protein